ncbi:MAG: hypothetical protein JRI80_16475 [Deltaproteobacteria bacterium]|nr:hypothetical protein [Deltaproteobacteria bacterium]
MKSIEYEGAEIVAKLMAVAARTAPKTAGADYIKTRILTKDEKEIISKKMDELGELKRSALSEKDPTRAKVTGIDWQSDTKAVLNSNLLMLIGIQGPCAEMVKADPFPNEEKDFPGPSCIFRVMDLGIAVGSAVKIAMDNNVDNRIMQKVGIAALKLELLKPCDLILGIPLSVTGKNIFFDRADKAEVWKLLGSKKK